MTKEQREEINKEVMRNSFSIAEVGENTAITIDLNKLVTIFESEVEKAKKEGMITVYKKMLGSITGEDELQIDIWKEFVREEIQRLKG